jgi:transcriptional regulator with PAS, ATPase and Fis domain
MTNTYDIIGSSGKICELLDLSKKIASTDVTVLITGESGTGKELFARFIHDNSPRSEEKFISINCAAIPDNLLENELFGHKKGAFTDAGEDYEGKFGKADKGTIFFDEVAEMLHSLQAKILRVIQYKEYEPVGGSETLKTDVRIIAATNKNLSLSVKEGKFREDLYYRLNVVPLIIPPLRERMEDIDELSLYFLEKSNSENNKSIKGFSKNTISIFKKYGWPGNIRELQNVVERSVVLCEKELIEIDEINSDLLNQEFLKEKNKSFKEAIIDFKREFIISSLDKNDWNQTKTAKILKIQRTYLARLIKELNIEKL